MTNTVSQTFSHVQPSPHIGVMSIGRKLCRPLWVLGSGVTWYDHGTCVSVGHGSLTVASGEGLKCGTSHTVITYCCTCTCTTIHMDRGCRGRRALNYTLCASTHTLIIAHSLTHYTHTVLHTPLHTPTPFTPSRFTLFSTEGVVPSLTVTILCWWAA